MNVSCKMPLAPPAQAGVLGEVSSPQRLPKNTFEFFPSCKYSETQAFGFAFSEV